MSFKILEKNGVDNENIDGAAFNNFSAGGRDGIVAGVLSECSLSLSGNVIGIAPGELIMHGFRVKITETETFSNSSVPVSAEKYQIIAQIVVSDNNDVVFSFLIRSPATLIQENIFDNNRGTYQIEIGTYMHNPDGSISELTRTVQVFYADIHKSAKEAKAASKEAAASAAAAQNAAKDAAQAASIAIADYITHTKNGAAVGEVDTLAGAKAEVEVGSKNLFNWKLAGKSENGITYTQNSDGSITVNGTATDRSYAYIIGYDIPINPGIYTFSGCPSGGQSTTYRLALSLYIDGVWQTNETDYGDSVTFEVALPINQMTAYIEIMSGTTVENLTFYPQLEYGETATPYTPYLPTGAAVEVLACGKNLFDLNADKYWGSADITERTGSTFTVSGQAETWIAVEFILPEIQNKTLTVSGEWITSGSNVGGLRVQWITQNGIAVGDTIAETYISGQAATGTVPKKPDNAKYLGFFVYSNTNGTVTGSTSVTYENVQIEIGETATYYVSFEGLTYPATVGQTIEVKQYDRITNIFTNTAGASLAVQFKISTQLYLDRFGLIEEGLFANRPTDISEQSRVYIATDRFDNSRYTYLKGGVDGSVTENWTEIVNYGQDNLQTKAKELVPAINEVNAAAGIALLNIPKSAKETGAFISGNNTLAGAKAEVEVQSKNLFDINKLKPPTTIDSLGGLSDIIQVTNGEMINPRPLYSNSAYINIPINLIKGTYTISGECWIDLNDPQGNVVYIGMWDGKKAGGSINTTITPGQWTKVQYTYIVEDLHAFTLQFQQGGNTASDTCTLKVRNIQLERGETATAFMPYLPAGTAVEVNACGKNLFDENGVTSSESAVFTELTAEQIKVSAIIEIPSGNAGYAGVAQKNIKAGQTVTINARWTTSTSANKGRVAIYWRNANIFIGQQLYSNTPLTVTIPNSTNENDVVYFYFYVATGGGSAAIGDEVTYTNITVNLGDKDLGFSTPVSATYQSAIGETIEVEQYDRITNIFSNTTGGAVCTQFLQSTRYELETKPVSLAGTYAKRPTGTYPYVVLYTATDTGRTYRLERDTDGSVSSNWVNISSAGGTGGGFTPRGEWNSATTYNENDLVSLNGSSYICIEENTNATPASNPDKWMVNAEKGATGATGPQGEWGNGWYRVDTEISSSVVNVDRSKLYPAEPAIVREGETVVYADGHIGKINSQTGTTVNISVYSISLQGPQGPAGANGKDYLVINRVLTSPGAPVVDGTRSINHEWCNRTAEVGDQFALPIISLQENQVYWCALEVIALGAASDNCKILSSQLIVPAPPAEKYIHHIRYTNESDIVYFTYINDSSDNYTAINDMYLLTTELANKQLDAKERSLMANGIVGGKTIIAVYGEADGVIWGVLTSGEDVAFTKANCKIDDLTIKI